MEYLRNFRGGSTPHPPSCTPLSTTKNKMDYKRIWKEEKKEYVVKVYGRRGKLNKKRKIENMKEQEEADEEEDQKHESDCQENERKV